MSDIVRKGVRVYMHIQTPGTSVESLCFFLTLSLYLKSLSLSEIKNHPLTIVSECVIEVFIICEVPISNLSRSSSVGHSVREVQHYDAKSSRMQ